MMEQSDLAEGSTPRPSAAWSRINRWSFLASRPLAPGPRPGAGARRRGADPDIASGAGDLPSSSGTGADAPA